MFGAKTKALETENKQLNFKIKTLERDVQTLQLNIEDVKSSRSKWRTKARSLRRQRKHLLQQLQIQGAEQ